MTQLVPAARRHRYYAYEAKAGGILWMDRISHLGMVRRPQSVELYQCCGYAGRSMLMTAAEWKTGRREWSASFGGDPRVSLGTASPGLRGQLVDWSVFKSE